MPHPLTGPALGFAARLKFPTLFKITVGLFLLDLVIPFDDFFPPFLLDELLLGLGALLLASWKKPEAPAAPATNERPVIEGESRRE